MSQTAIHTRDEERHNHIESPFWRIKKPSLHTHAPEFTNNVHPSLTILWLGRVAANDHVIWYLHSTTKHKIMSIIAPYVAQLKNPLALLERKIHISSSNATMRLLKKRLNFCDKVPGLNRQPLVGTSLHVISTSQRQINMQKFHAQVHFNSTYICQLKTFN